MDPICRYTASAVYHKTLFHVIKLEKGKVNRMKKKFLILTAALALVVAQSSYAVAARSSSNSSSGNVTVIDRTNGGGSGSTAGGQTTAPTTGTTTTESGLAATSVTNNSSATTVSGAVDASNAVLGAVKSTVTSAGTTITTTTVALSTVNGVVVTEAIAPNAAPEVSANSAAAATAWIADKTVTTSSTFSGYAPGAVGVLQTVNANPAALASLPSTTADLSKYAMLTNFQTADVTNAAGQKVDAQAGQCLTIEVPSLVQGMKVYMAYVDPVSNYTYLIQIPGVDFANRLVHIDARYATAAWSIVYEK